ncbi:GAF domain-containing protein [Oleiharenicola lentus]|uniref:GAF domain-containing protein n=1 Tax=Oleiharenicola lentus TaxID=2508720 RepID=UPI003F669ADA
MTDLAPRPNSPELNQILIQVMDRITEFLEVERSTLFLHDPASHELWTPVAQGTQEIRLPENRGIAGHVFTSGETVRITDAYADPRFNSAVDKQTGFRTRDIFARPLTNSTGKRMGVIQLINRRHGPLTPRDEKLLDAICNQAGIAIENAQLFLNLKQVNDSERALHAELETNHAELRSAFLKIEESAAAQELLGRRVQKVRLVALIVVVSLFVGVGLFAWLSGSSGGEKSLIRKDDAPPITWHTVAKAPVRTGLVLLGNIEPLEIVNVTAPLRGRVTEKNFAYGELVTKGQSLAKIDTADTVMELSNAEVVHFRATAELRRLEDWIKGPEVARADRNLLKARLNFEANERNLREMEKLSKLGIIAQTSLDSAKQNFVMQESDYKSVQEEMNSVLAAATPDRLTVARNDLANAQMKVDELRSKISRAKLTSPVAGIVILPNTRPTAGRAAGSDGFFENGSTIGQGEILAAIGNLEGVAVKTRADEVDIARIGHGQSVRITGDAFPGRVLNGRVEYVSSQATATGARPYFEIIVKTGQLSSADLAAVRLGMTAKLDITTYEAASAIVAPVSAVRRESGGTFVFRKGKSGEPEKLAVEIGTTTPDAVEITKGLAVGDIVATEAKSVAP